jgi:hypothetical protein
MYRKMLMNAGNFIRCALCVNTKGAAYYLGTWCANLGYAQGVRTSGGKLPGMQNG